MIIADKFVFVHVPKTGGTWVRRVLERGPEAWKVRVIYPGHHCLAGVDVGSRLPFAFVRNPWDWNISRASFWNGQYVNGTGPFALPREQWKPVCHRWEQRILTRGPGIKRLLRTTLLDECGVFSLADRICALTAHPNVECSFGRYENLRAEMERLLSESGAKFGRRMEAMIREKPPENTSRHRDYRSYYDDELISAVAEKEKRVIERFGYEFSSKHMLKY